MVKQEQWKVEEEVERHGGGEEMQKHCNANMINQNFTFFCGLIASDMTGSGT